ncbi:MAG: glycerophosphoryl diester phosphodiesterase [Acidobacteriaceae bacterium]|nr:glycerophosphoryl diester phosphodiesterase [Acidobacteriaceae bacterium]
MKPPLLLGHRGLRSRSFSVRENTLAAFDLALQHGCDGFEFDVRLTADDTAVICHGHRFASITIAKAIAARLRSLPLLEDVLERYASRAFLDIELKVPGIESQVLTAISHNPPERGYVVSSFLPDVLIDLRSRNQSVPLGIICETRKQLSIWRDLPIQYVIANERLITPELLRDAQNAGKAVFAWTINNKASMVRLANSGIDGIISDKTCLLVETLRAL